jgi:hypothetical protein
VKPIEPIANDGSHSLRAIQLSGTKHTIGTAEARRLALNRAGLLKPEWTRMPARLKAGGQSGRTAAHRIIDRFGYLQIDTVSVAGARSHAIVLLSRIEGFDPETAERLLQPGEPLFEYWGHEASWMPLTLYPTFAFRRQEFRRHPWWGDVVGRHPKAADELRRRIRCDGPIRSIDMDGRGSRGWWDLKIARRIVAALWSAGELAIRERRHFHRIFDLTERVIPDAYRSQSVSKPDAVAQLLLLALSGHGWATTGTLAQTWRLRQRDGVASALKLLVEKGDVVPCNRLDSAGERKTGWIRPGDLEVAARLKRVRPRKDRGVLLSPFDPLLWDRKRVRDLFAFDQVLEIFKPAAKRIYGYYCLPVLAGERLVARIDLKAERKAGRLNVRALSYERKRERGEPSAQDKEAVRTALQRFAHSVALKPNGAGVN